MSALAAVHGGMGYGLNAMGTTALPPARLGPVVSSGIGHAEADLVKRWQQLTTPTASANPGQGHNRTLSPPVAARQTLESALARGAIAARKNPWPKAAALFATPFIIGMSVLAGIQLLPTYNDALVREYAPLIAGAIAVLMLVGPLFMTDLASTWEHQRSIELRRTMKRTVFCGVRHTIPLWKFFNLTPFDLDTPIAQLKKQQEELKQLGHRLRNIINSCLYTPVEACDTAEHIRQSVGRRFFAHRMNVFNVDVDGHPVVKDGSVLQDGRFKPSKMGGYMITGLARMEQHSTVSGGDFVKFRIKAKDMQDLVDMMEILLSGRPVSAMGKVEEIGFLGFVKMQLARFRAGNPEIVDIEGVDQNNFYHNSAGVVMHRLMYSEDIETVGV
ncbi:MAG: hypothetical protein HQM16_15715 [Deltaproteobacteria bacterium]|nr:hypothetical protein [Deltaproteobacteria bacterium]